MDCDAVMDVFGTRRIAALQKALDIAEGQIERLREENRRLLCAINPHLKAAFFPEEQAVSLIDPPSALQQLCSVQMSEKQIRFCAVHKMDLDAEGRCPVTGNALYRKPIQQKRRILGSEFCRGKDEKFEEVS